MIVLFAIVSCPSCGNERMIDLSTGTTSCPFCGKKSDTGVLAVKFKHADQSIVRDVLHGKPLPSVRDSPMSELAFRVAQVKDPGKKIIIISENISKIKEEFTLEDIEELVPGEGEKYIGAMLEDCIIYEVGYGRYRV